MNKKETKSVFKNPKRANELNGSDWTKFSISVWNDITLSEKEITKGKEFFSVWNDIRKTSEESMLHHPAMFPVMLPDRLIKCFTTSNDMNILDPFMGSGSTLLAAFNLGRRGIGFEINEEYIKLAESRMTQDGLFVKNIPPKIYSEDARLIPEKLGSESVHLCITSPPYWDILSQKRTADKKNIRDYGDNAGDLSRVTNYEDFLEGLIRIFEGVYKVLIPEKYCIVNVMDLRKGNRFFPLHSDLAIKMQKAGFIFDDIIIWDRRQDYNNLRSLGFPYVFRLNKIHEYLLIFQKPKKRTEETTRKISAPPRDKE